MKMAVYEIEYAVTRKIEVSSETPELAKRFIEQTTKGKRDINFISVVEK